jgi:glycosyltransferase involved in cell wall biosynthesis
MLFCRNRDLTVTNKLLQYLLGGLAVVASDTAGQREVANQASSAISLYPSGNPIVLADRLNALLNSRDRLQTAKAAALQAAQTVFCWERQEDVLLRRIHRALGSR